MFTDVPESTDEDYRIKCPSKEQYLCTCNEFWWCLNNVAKGLWRGEIPYVQDMLNFHVRKQLETMLSWKIGIETNFTVSVGKSAKYMYRWLTEEEWNSYLSTYCGADIEESWDAIFRMCDLFDASAKYVGMELEYTYNGIESENARYFLKHVRALPKDTTEIF